METIFNPHRLGHVNLVVHELERSTRFYQSVCGLALEFSEVGLRGNFLGSGRTHHDVGMIERTTEDRYGKDGHLQIPKSAADQVRLNHVAWEMDTEKDLVQAIGRARAHGVPLLRVSDHQITHSVYLKDPDGNVVEFYSDVIRDWRTVLHGEVDHITSVWTPDEASASVERMCNELSGSRKRGASTALSRNHSSVRTNAWITQHGLLRKWREGGSAERPMSRGRPPGPNESAKLRSSASSRNRVGSAPLRT